MFGLFKKTERAWEQLSAGLARKDLERFTVIDVREGHEFSGRLGHIATAQNIPLGALSSSIATIATDKPLLVVCHSGRRSAAACGQLSNAGHSEVFNLDGGMSGWASIGFPVERATSR